jgi:hypothetical protein
MPTGADDLVPSPMVVGYRAGALLTTASTQLPTR